MNWLLRNWDQVAVALGQHVAIALTALVIAFAEQRLSRYRAA